MLKNPKLGLQFEDIFSLNVFIIEMFIRLGGGGVTLIADRCNFQYLVYLLLTLQRKRLPDGRNEIEASQMVFQNVTRKHSGTYICEASNGPGQTAIDSVVIDVLRKSSCLYQSSQRNAFTCSLHNHCKNSGLIMTSSAIDISRKYTQCL